MPPGYCSKCRANVEIDGGEEFTSRGKSKRPGIRGSCPTCGSVVIHWISKYEDESQGPPEEEAIPSGDPVPPSPPEEISIDDLQEVPPDPAPESPATPPPATPPPAPKEEEKEEEEEGSDWMEWIPIIVVVLGVAFLFIGAWLLWSNSKKKEEAKTEEKKKAQETPQYGPGTDILPEGI